ncbi:phage holin [Tetragenococcus halophilus]|uniref:phage holin n=1 Tax=Tetragenococcus halophilus TaxID=51669 RepID=UPI002A95B968|nr:hypothetical protein TEHSL10_11340 [Tetragenococcus halophilus]
MLDDKTYNLMKWIVIIAVPAVMTAIGTIGQAIGFEQTDLFLTIIGALNTCLGTMLGISNKKYKKQGPKE